MFCSTTPHHDGISPDFLQQSTQGALYLDFSALILVPSPKIGGRDQNSRFAVQEGISVANLGRVVARERFIDPFQALNMITGKILSQEIEQLAR